MSRIARGVITLTDIADGQAGVAGARDAIKYLYSETTDDTVPSAPSATITWASGALSSISASWSETPPTVDATGTNRPWVSVVVFHQDSSSSQTATTTATGQTPSKGFTFNGVVTFTDTGDTGGISATDGTTSRTLLTPSSVGAAGTTVIHGGRISTDTLNANAITTDTLTLGQVTNQTEASQGTIEFTNTGMIIKDGAGNIRVKIGKLN